MAKETEKPDANPTNVPAISPSLMRDQMELEAQIPAVQGTGEIVERIQAAILAGQSDEDVFAAAAAGLASGEQYVDKPLSLLNYAYNKSAFTDTGGAPVYAVVEAVALESGEKVTFSLGAMSALAQLHRWEALQPFAQRDGLPCSIASKRTAQGFDALYFRPLTPAEQQRVGL